MSKLRFKDFMAVCFVVIYGIIQIYAIKNPGGQDDIISARAQDIIMLILSHYFLHSKKQEIK